MVACAGISVNQSLIAPEEFMERSLVRLLSAFFSTFRFPGSYRLASAFYDYRAGSKQKGIWLVKPYLNRKYNLFINLFSKDLIDHKILFTGTYERYTNEVLENHIREGFWVVEAGANSGTETLLLSRLTGAAGKVFAFEPVAHVVDKLKKNIELNSITNVQVEMNALGEQEKEISFFIYPQDHPNQGMGSKVLERRGLQKITVNQTTLDRMLEQGKLSRLDFLKLDVQGAELDILHGGKMTIARFHPAIFVEAADSLSNLNSIFDFLKELNYVVYHIHPEKGLQEISPSNLKRGNWLALFNQAS